jgi:hypothetical protein
MDVEAALAEFAADLPPGQRADALLAPPEPQLLDRLLADVRDSRRTTRHRRLYLVAAAVALIIAGPVVTALATSSSNGSTAVSATASGTAPAGVRAKVTMTDESWGTDLGLTLSGVHGPLSCKLVAVSSTGASQTATTWAVPDAGYGMPGMPKPLTVWGGTGFSRGQIDHFDVRTLDGRTLVSVKE